MATMVAVADAVATVAVVVLGPEAMAEVARQAEIQVRVVEPTEAVGTERCRAGTAALKLNPVAEAQWEHLDHISMAFQ